MLPPIHSSDIPGREEEMCMEDNVYIKQKMTDNTKQKASLVIEERPISMENSLLYLNFSQICKGCDIPLKNKNREQKNMQTISISNIEKRAINTMVIVKI